MSSLTSAAAAGAMPCGWHNRRKGQRQPLLVAVVVLALRMLPLLPPLFLQLLPLLLQVPTRRRLYSSRRI
jgi:hypothetical protein